MIYKKAAPQMLFETIVVAVLLIILLVIVFYGIGPNGFTPLKQKVVNLYNSVLVKLNINTGSDSCKSVVVLKKQAQLCFDESTGCWIDLGDKTNPEKYAVKWDDTSGRYILLYYDNIKKSWEDVDKTIPDEETINIFEIYNALNNAKDNGMKINFESSSYELFLSERGLGIILPAGEYYLSIGNKRGYLFRSKYDEWTAVNDLSEYETEVYYALSEFSLNFKIKINETEKIVSFGEAPDGLKTSLIMYVSVDGIYYGINSIGELFIKNTGEWAKKPRQKIIDDYSDIDYSPLYDATNWKENLERKQIKDELIAACEEF